MDYLKKGGLGSGTGNPLIYGHPWMPIPPTGKRPPHQNGGHFGPEGVEVLDKNGLICVLTLALDEEYKLYPQPVPSPTRYSRGFWQKSPKVWAGKNPVGLARHWAPVLVQLNAWATSA